MHDEPITQGKGLPGQIVGDILEREARESLRWYDDASHPIPLLAKTLIESLNLGSLAPGPTLAVPEGVDGRSYEARYDALERGRRRLEGRGRGLGRDRHFRPLSDHAAVTSRWARRHTRHSPSQHLHVILRHSIFDI